MGEANWKRNDWQWRVAAVKSDVKWKKGINQISIPTSWSKSPREKRRAFPQLVLGHHNIIMYGNHSLVDKNQLQVNSGVVKREKETYEKIARMYALCTITGISGGCYVLKMLVKIISCASIQVVTLWKSWSQNAPISLPIPKKIGKYPYPDRRKKKKKIENM